MTLDELLSLITGEHADRPDFRATMTALLQPFADAAGVMLEFPAEYDLDVAVASQLDVVGQWVGLSRNLPVPITGVYFSFDTPGVGFDEGVWLGPGDPLEGIVSLDDETYRLMLYIKIAANSWDGTLEQAQAILRSFIAASPSAGTTRLFVQDNFDMTMTIGLAGTVPSVLFTSLLQRGFFALRPAGVGTQVVVTSVDGSPIFGFNNDNDYIGGFDRGAWGTPLPNI